MIDQKQIDKILNKSSVYKFTSIDKHIAFVLGNNVERCKAALYKTTALKVTLIDERSAIRLKNYVQKDARIQKYYFPSITLLFYIMKFYHFNYETI